MTPHLGSALTIQIPENPFPGLRPFEFHESELFFGRDGQSEKLIEKLIPARFVAVVGTSGSGKSSLVRAGVVPALLGGFTPGAGSTWRVAMLRPGNEPIANLARALNDPGVFGSDDKENNALQIALANQALRRGSRGLVEAVHQTNLPANENLLVIVDQFEEIFRYTREHRSEAVENEAAAFVKLLLTARAQSEVNIYVILTMRSDFLGDCAKFQDLPESINESQYLIPRLTRDQLREAITGPAAVAKGEIAQPLVNRLLNDIGDDQDQLPILQHALMRTWQEWRNRRHEHLLDQGPGDPQPVDRMNLCCYEAVGGWKETLSRHADEAYHELNARQQAIAEKMFKLLTEKDRDNRAIRRLTKVGEIRDVAEASIDEIAVVIDTFRKSGRSFLMIPAGGELTEDSLIDISHESLIRNWNLLSDWVEEEAASADDYRRLAASAERHRGGRESLLSGSGLQTAIDWREKQSPTPAWAQRYFANLPLLLDYLEQSRQAQEAEASRKNRDLQEKIERDKRELRRTRIFAAVVVVMLVLAMILAGVAWQQRSSAIKADETSRSLYYVASMNSAQTAFDGGNRPLGYQILEEFMAPHDSELREFSWYYLWRENHHEKLMLKGHADWIYSAAFSPDGRTIAGASWDKTVKLWKADTGLELREFKGHTDRVYSVAFSPDGLTLASASSKGTSAGSTRWPFLRMDSRSLARVGTERSGSGMWPRGGSCAGSKGTPAASTRWPFLRMDSCSPVRVRT